MAGEYLTRREVANLLGCSEGTLRHWHTKAKGPRGFKLDGRRAVRYSRSEVYRWLGECERENTAAPSIEVVMRDTAKRVARLAEARPDAIDAIRSQLHSIADSVR